MTGPRVELADRADIARYVELAQDAQCLVRSKGLTQWVPAAHAGFLPKIEARVERRSLYKVLDEREAIGFFDFSFDATEWWSGRGDSAGYISGIVVARAGSGRGVGSFILRYAEEIAREGGAHCLRLDCHAENTWLCEYYRSKGFAEVARLEQHPGYLGALFEKVVSFEG